jgi:hypothetical protein
MAARSSRRSTWLLAAFFLLASVSAHAEIVFYSNDNFDGRSYASEDDIPNLDKVGFNDKASSIKVRHGRWEVCSDADFRGKCVTLEPGEYPSLHSYGLNDKLSSARPLRRARWKEQNAVIFKNNNFEGEWYSLERTSQNLAGEGFNDKASSIIIYEGKWELCNDADFRGRCVTLGPGKYPSLKPMGLNDKMSSIRRVRR